MIVSLAADDARSVTAKNNVSGMAFTLSINTIYVYDFWLPTTSNAATVGVQFGFSFPGAVTRHDAVLEYYSASATLDTIAIANSTSANPSFNPTASQGNVTRAYRLTGRISVGATGGAFQLQHGSETATLTTLLAGAFGVCIPTT